MEQGFNHRQHVLNLGDRTRDRDRACWLSLTAPGSHSAKRTAGRLGIFELHEEPFISAKGRHAGTAESQVADKCLSTGSGALRWKLPCVD